LGDVDTPRIDNLGSQIANNGIQVSSKADGDGTVWFEHRRSE